MTGYSLHERHERTVFLRMDVDRLLIYTTRDSLINYSKIFHVLAMMAAYCCACALKGIIQGNINHFSVLLCLLDTRVSKIRNETSSRPGIFSRILRFTMSLALLVYIYIYIYMYIYTSTHILYIYLLIYLCIFTVSLAPPVASSLLRVTATV